MDTEAINTLIRYNVEPNMADGLDKTPLFYAVELGQIKVVDILMKNRAELNWIDL